MISPVRCVSLRDLLVFGEVVRSGEERGGEGGVGEEEAGGREVLGETGGFAEGRGQGGGLREF